MLVRNPTFDVQRLHESGALRFGVIRWSAELRTRSSEQHQAWPEISFALSGAFAIRVGRRGAVCDANTVAFLGGERPYCLEHPVAGNRRCLALLLEPALARALVGECDPAAGDRLVEEIFTHESGPCDPATHAAIRALAARAAAPGADALEIEERALAVARRVLRAAHRQHARPPGPARISTRRAHRELAESAKAVLNDRLDEPLTLAEVAAQVHAAPAHLSAVFSREVGLPMHRYRNRLRLAASFDRLIDPATDLGRLAVELGFAHHSHFTATFRREFGAPPSRFRHARSNYERT